jgi:hypothetical protein
MLDHRAAGLVARLRELSSHRTVVLFDYTTNGDVTDLSAPLSHAALIAQRQRPAAPGRVRARAAEWTGVFRRLL